MAVLVLALGVRLLLVATSRGGFAGNYGYDAGVYYSAADALIHGRVPYSNFLLLHPPGLMLTLTPFALLGRVTADHAGFVAANLAFSALGAANAVLVYRIGRRIGSGRPAALVGGGLYAVWLSAAGPEISARLEPLGTSAFLLGTLLLIRTEQVTRRSAVAGGALLGFAVTVKIWWVVPLIVFVGWWSFARRDLRSAVGVAIGSVASWVLVAGPFFAMAPSAMLRMVVTDQLGRHPVRPSPITRIFSLSGLDQFADGPRMRLVATALVLGVAVVCAAAAWGHTAARPFVLVAVVQTLVLLLSPSFFGYYSGFVAAPATLVVAAAARRPRDSVRRHPRLPVSAAVAILAVAVVATGDGLVSGHPAVTTSKPLALGHLTGTVKTVHCVVSDSPMALIALDSLSRDLAHGCPDWVDVSGRTYDLDAANGTRSVGRRQNPRWQADILRYLLSGDAVVVIRSQTGLSPTTLRVIKSLPVLGAAHHVTIHRVDSRTRSHVDAGQDQFSRARRR